MMHHLLAREIRLPERHEIRRVITLVDNFVNGALVLDRVREGDDVTTMLSAAFEESEKAFGRDHWFIQMAKNFPSDWRWKWPRAW